ncbi:unnamed protein product [Ectocarpus sp. 6 AP-2014]
MKCQGGGSTGSTGCQNSRTQQQQQQQQGAIFELACAACITASSGRRTVHDAITHHHLHHPSD